MSAMYSTAGDPELTVAVVVLGSPELSYGYASSTPAFELLEHGALAQSLLPPGKYGNYSGNELDNGCQVIRLHFFVITLML